MKNNRVLENVAEYMSDTEVITYIRDEHINHHYLESLKQMTLLKDNQIAKLLNMSLRSFQDYKNHSSKDIPFQSKEILLLLVSLYKHSKEIFRSTEDFNRWLDTQNVFLDNLKPFDFLNSVSGIRFIDSRLTALEYGDNI